MFLVIRINLFFDMSLKFRNHDHKFLHPIINISRSQDTLWVTHDPMDFKGIFSETIYFKKILFSKLIHIIRYLDNLKTCSVLIIGDLWVTSDPIDLNDNKRST